MGTYDLVLHRYGLERIIVSVHMELPDGLTAREIHGLTRSITADVYYNHDIILTVGIYASNSDDERYVDIKNKLLKLSSGYPEILQLHGFYVDAEKKQISFDLIIDFKCQRKMAIRDNLIEQIKQLYPEYNFAVVLDNNFSD